MLLRSTVCYLLPTVGSGDRSLSTSSLSHSQQCRRSIFPLVYIPDTLALLFLKRITFLPCPKTLQLLFLLECSSLGLHGLLPRSEHFHSLSFTDVLKMKLTMRSSSPCSPFSCSPLKGTLSLPTPYFPLQSS